MRTRLSLFFGIFAVMALSNAIVPVLPVYALSSALQAAIYSAYFLGAFLSTLPGGILSDRYGRVPMMRLGLAITVTSGLLLSVLVSPFPVIVVRFIEGVGGGFFVAASMSYVNSLPDHEKKSGYFMALLNAGLVTGLAFSGWLASHTSGPGNRYTVFCRIVPDSCMCKFFCLRESCRYLPGKSQHPDIACQRIPVVVVLGSDPHRCDRGGYFALPQIFRLFTRKCRDMDLTDEYCNHCRSPGCIPALVATRS